ncbi:CBK1 kinase activator protein MOB2 [Spathaspora sp. JA1]|nr:CBK1 kinase activator protein MOB2 [Spathaspora sp. JA1]
MSFLNTIRGLGRSSKKNKNELEPNAPLYSNTEVSRRRQSPTRGNGNSPSKSVRSNNDPVSPTKRNRGTIQQQQQQQQQQQRQQQLQQQPILQKQTQVQFQQSGGSPKRTSLSKSNSQDTSNGSKNPVQLPLFLCEPYVKTALVKGSFKTIVQLPKYVDYGEWLALNIFELFNNLNRCYGVISDYVTREAFPTMNAGPNVNYLWVDSNGQAVNLPACQYIEYVTSWISNKLNDQSIFPTKNGGAFPPNFLKDCKNITRQMFRIFAFIYHNHFEKIVHLSLEAHWNSFFAHFISFVKEFNLIDRNELEPLLPLIENFEQQGKII